MTARRFSIRDPAIRQRAAEYVAGLPVDGEPFEVVVAPFEETRNGEQNSKLWAMLTDISRQVQWPVNGHMQRLSKEDWKDVLSAGLEQGQRIAQGIEGGFVMLGSRTSRMKKKRMAELIELIQFFGDSHGVRWTAPTHYDEVNEQWDVKKNQRQ